MLKYYGEACPVCKEDFMKGDDVVVCPICGAPHHRDCYKQHQGCALLENHAKGIAWTPTHGPVGPQSHAPQGANAPRPGAEVNLCPSCKEINTPDAIFCCKCGTPLTTAKNNTANNTHPMGGGYGGGPTPPYGQSGYGGGPTPPYGQAQYGQYDYQTPQAGAPYYSAMGTPYAGLNPEEEIEGVTIKEYATFVGRTAHYYLPRFKIMSQGGRAFLFNWAAFFFSFFYFFYRKMNKIGMLLLAILALTAVPSLLYAFEYSKEVLAQYGSLMLPLPEIVTPALTKLALIANFARSIQFAIACVLGFVANRLYFNHASSTIHKIKERSISSTNTNQYIGTLSLQGGVSIPMVVMAAGIIFFAYMAVSYLFAAILML